MDYSFTLGIVMNFGKLVKWIPTFIDGTVLTIILSLTTVFFGSIIGLFATLLQQSPKKALRGLANIYTQVIRGTPLLVQLYIWLYGFPMIGLSIPALPFLGETFGSRDFLTAVVAL
ncbi:MAG: ABC transporter permease subunit, partial [Enterococcus lemanii]